MLKLTSVPWIGYGHPRGYFSARWKDGASENLDETTHCSAADVINFVVVDMIAAPQRARNSARKGRGYVLTDRATDGKTNCNFAAEKRRPLLGQEQNEIAPDPPFQNGREKAYPIPRN